MRLAPDTWPGAAALSIAAAAYLAMLASFRHGFDLTDDAYALYNLIYTRSETPFSGAAWPFSWTGALVGHHILYYRALSLVLNVAAGAYLVETSARVLAVRIKAVLPQGIAFAFVLVLAMLHQANLPGTTYNAVHMFGLTLIAGGVAQCLADAAPRRIDIAAAAFGATCCLLARTVSGLAIVAGISLIVIPLLRSLGVVSTKRRADWLAGSLLAGIPLALLIALVMGNLGGLLATQRIMLEAGGGGATYVATVTQAWTSTTTFVAAHSLSVGALAIGVAAAFFFPARWRPAAIVAALLLFIGWRVVHRTGNWTTLGLVYLVSGTASAIAVCSLASFRARSTNAPARNSVALLLAMLTSLPVIATLGTSNNLALVVHLYLGPLGVLLALPLAQSEHGDDRPAAASELTGATARQAAAALLMVLLGTIAFHALWMREHHTYRLKTPLSSKQTERLDGPAPLRGLRVSPDTHAHISQLAAISRLARLDRDDTRAVSIYRSPGSLLAMEVPALGPPWLFDHIPDAAFNCRLMANAERKPPRLAIVLNHAPREEILRCLEDFGYGARDTWRPLGCVARTTASAANLTPQACLFEAIRRR